MEVVGHLCLGACSVPRLSLASVGVWPAEKCDCESGSHKVWHKLAQFSLYSRWTIWIIKRGKNQTHTK
jgi:hypothetical protein